MRLVPHSNSDGYRVFMEPHEYETMLECASRDRAEIAFRLGGECSLRKKEVLEVTLDKIQKSRSPDVEIFFMRVWGKETRKENSKKPRKPWVPISLLEELERYSKRKNIRPSSPLYPKSKGTLQNDIVDARERAADKTGDDDFLEVTFHDFRRYFATNLFYRERVKIEFIAALGGWEDPDYMKEEYLDPYFDDVIERHLAQKGVLDIETDHQSDFEKVLSKMDQLGDRIDTLERIIAEDTEEQESEEPETGESDDHHSFDEFL
ncbi:site-specific integrase [Natronomonas gomsonensis]|uniref:site-specific integrase n=1 Tax=Natronomonas gomsonensis TaxID=1046043 RepID=UPI001FEA9961|nr:site-specific integrase [Natronomonas gomsonensis]